MNRIPFLIVNSVDVSPDMHRPPILDLVDLNLSHFRTSADYENALHVLSQPTAVITGLPEEHPAKFQIGGPQIWRLPEGASAAYLEMQSDGIQGTERALASKEQQMREIGAQMLSSIADSPETATSLRIRQHSQTSVLSSIAGTCSSGLEAALQMALDWDGITGEAEVELNQDFLEAMLDPQMLAELTRTVDAGFMTDEDFVWNLIRGEMVRPGQTPEEIVEKMRTRAPSLRSMRNPSIPDPFLAAKAASEGNQPPKRSKGFQGNQNRPQQRPVQVPPRPKAADE
jgi:hypothetical protein